LKDEKMVMRRTKNWGPPRRELSKALMRKREKESQEYHKSLTLPPPKIKKTKKGVRKKV